MDTSSRREHEQPYEQQQEEEEDFEVPDHYFEAQRAAVEAVQVGRATLETTERQGEQLRNADRMADQTQYMLDQSGRILRGMTWTGWVQNILSPSSSLSSSNRNKMKKDHELSSVEPIALHDIPPFADEAVQAIQSYRANLMVLQVCETPDQWQTCVVVCQNMFDKAAKEIKQLQVEDNNPTVVHQLSRELSKLHQQHKDAMQHHYLMEQKVAAMKAIPSSLSKQEQEVPSILSKHVQQQDDHLDMLGSHLGELNIMANSLQEQISQHNTIMTKLDDKSDDIYDKTREVTRRADRLIQKKGWTPPKKVFEKWITIKHVTSGRYLSVSTAADGKVQMMDVFYPEKCVFGVWMRKNGSLFGLKNKYTNRFLGQTLLGSLACSSSSFGQREEWQADHDDDHDWDATRLLIASAGWGKGGYLKARIPGDGALQIVMDKTKADIWCLSEIHSER